MVKKGKRQQEDRASCLTVEDEDVGVHALVEGCLGDDEHASVDQLVSWVIDSLSVPSRAHSNLQQVTWNYVSSIGAGRASLLKTDHALIFYYPVIDFQLGGCPPGIKKIYPPHFSTHTD